MSDILSKRAARSVVVPLTALVIASASLVALTGTVAAAPPEPTASIEASCVNDPLGDGNYAPVVDFDIDAAYKGRWVGFLVTVSVDNATNSPKDRTISRHDSGTSFTDRFTFLNGATQSTQASVEVRVLDNKGAPVGLPFTWSGGCQ